MEPRASESTKDSARELARNVLINVFANLVAAAIILAGATVVPAIRVMDLPVHAARYTIFHARGLGVIWTNMIGDEGAAG